MKILAFVDIHGNQRAIDDIARKSKQADLLLCAGDISMFENHLPGLLEQLESMNKLVLIVHGNHESTGIMELGCTKLKNLVFFHKKAEIINNTLFMGFGGGGFEQSSPEMEKFFKKHKKALKNAEKAVFITHAPPYKTKLDQINSGHQGNNTLRNLIIKHQPVLAVCGHFHENSGKADTLGMSKIVNPGPYGELLEL